MKTHATLLSTLFAITMLPAQDATDPTQPSPRMKAAMMTKGSSIPALIVKGVVMGRGKKGVVLLEAGSVSVVARSMVPFNVTVEGASVQLVVKGIGSNGIEIENAAAKETVQLSSAGAIEESMTARPDADIAYLELRDATLMDALRMIADQSGNNYSASSTANKTVVSAFLRNVSADNAVEEICKSHSLWFKKDEVSGITRIMDVKEFEKDLVGFREEQTEVFTLLYPNAIDVAITLADVFGDRVELSLGNEDMNEDARDLQSRFTRFNVIGQGNLTASAYQNSSTTYNGTNGANVVGGGGGAFGGAGGFNGGYGGLGGGFETSGGGSSNTAERYRQRRQQNQGQARSEDMTDRFTGLTSGQAERLQEALQSPPGDARAADDIQALRKSAPSIFVTASRRNNTIVVRTADSKIMEDIRSLIRRLDVPTPLVLLEVKVLRITLGDGFQSAFDYQFSDGRIGSSFTTGAINPSITYDTLSNQAVGTSSLAGENSTGLRDGQFVFTYLGDSLRARIQLLETKNRVNTVAAPTLLTSHNEVSRLFLGEERPVVRNISSQTILTDNNAATTPNTQVEFRSVGTTLLITPNINSDRTVTLRLLQENSSINHNGASIPVVTTSTNGGDATGVTNVPVDVVTSRSVSGTFAAADGKAVVVGGLIEDEDNDVREQIPVLGRIPVLGTLFRRQDKNKGKSEMIMIIKPHILSTPTDGQKISQELMTKLSTTSRDRLVEHGLLPPPPPEYAEPVAPPAPRHSAPRARAVSEPPPSAKEEVKPKRKLFWQKQ